MDAGYVQVVGGDGSEPDSTLTLRIWALVRGWFGRGEVPLALFGLLLRALSLDAFGLDELGGIVHWEAAEFRALGTEQGCAGAGVAGVTVRVEGAHPVLVCASVLRPVLAGQERQALVAVTFTGRGSFGARGCDSLGGVAHSGISLCSAFCDLCSPFG